MDKKEKAKKDKKEQKEEGNTGEGKVSVIVTVKDDPEGERKLMEALAEQTVRPDEVVVVRAEEYGNCSRGRGRNIGVKMARNEVIAVTDAGCRPHKDWLNKLYKCYKSYKSDKLVVAGWYRAEAKTELQRVMAGFLIPIAKIAKISENREREINGDPAFGYKGLAFLPASRSIMFTKKAWEAVGGYPEEAVSGGEDLEFARRLARHPGVKMIYCPQALVDWEPPATLGEFFRDIVKHTRGNVEVGYLPHLIKNFTVVLRWMVFLAFPWMIPIYLGIKIIKIINTIDGLRSHLAIRQGDTLNLNKVIKIINIAQIIIVQLAADGGVIVGLVLGMWGRLGRFGKLGKLG